MTQTNSSFSLNFGLDTIVGLKQNKNPKGTVINLDDILCFKSPTVTINAIIFTETLFCFRIEDYNSTF